VVEFAAADRAGPLHHTKLGSLQTGDWLAPIRERIRNTIDASEG